MKFNNADNFIDYLKGLLGKGEPLLRHIDYVRLREVENCIRTITKEIQNSTCDVQFRVESSDELCLGDIALYITATRLTLISTPKLREAFSKSKNFDVTPLLNGKVELSISFNDVYYYESLGEGDTSDV